MRILVDEVVSNGARERPVPASLAREGIAMRDALVADLVAAGHDVVTSPTRRVDGVWLIAPETGGEHERAARMLESEGARLLGSSAATIARASDKHALATLLLRHGIPHPETRLLRRDADAPVIARAIGYPVVVKPSRGAGCVGVSIATNPRELSIAVRRARLVSRRRSLLLQRYIAGIPASVSLVADGARARALALNRQHVSAAALELAYVGGETPLDHPLSARALDVAVRACEAVTGLRGFAGVDLVLADRDAYVIEINPRVTTAYLGVRAALDANVASLALAACSGELPGRTAVLRHVSWGEPCQARLRGPDKVRATPA